MILAQDRHIDQWMRIEFQEIDLYIGSIDFFFSTKLRRFFSGERIVSSTKVAGSVDVHKPKKVNLTGFIPHTI